MKARNLKLFYLHELLFQFSDTMLILVLPVFLYHQFQSLSAVFLFVIAWNFIHSLLFLPVFNLAMKWKSPRQFMMIGIFFYMISQGIFSLIGPHNHWMIIPAAFTFAFYVSFYWALRHWFISVNADYKVIGRQMSVVYLIRVLITFMAPIIGGAVSYWISFNATFLLGMLASAASLIPIALFSAEPHPEKYSLKKLITAFKKPEIRAVSPGYFWEGACFILIGYSWILAYSIFIGNILNLGVLIGVTTLITGFAIWATGTWFDKKSRGPLLVRITRLRTITVMAYVTLYFFPHAAYVWLIEFMNRLTNTAQNTVLDSYLYAYGNKLSPVDFMMVREVYLSLSRFLIAGLLALTFHFFSASYLWLAIFFGAFAVMGLTYAKRNDHHLV